MQKAIIFLLLLFAIFSFLNVRAFVYPGKYEFISGIPNFLGKECNSFGVCSNVYSFDLIQFYFNSAASIIFLFIILQVISFAKRIYTKEEM